jgi:predicted ATPase/DNA-binding CsgD family transcriptional regulator/class 3 adenylate cyclase
MTGSGAAPSAGACVDPGQMRAAGAVTLLLAGIATANRLQESDLETVSAATAGLNAVADETFARHGGARPGVPAGGLSALFARPSDAVACALDLQLGPLGLIGLRVCLHAEKARSRAEGYLRPVMNRAARLLELAHGGQTVLSGATGELVADRLPEGAWLADLGSHRLADLGRAERVWQLCHPDVRLEFPALMSLDSFPHNLPVQLTRFIGREAEMTEVRGLLEDHGLVTLTGAGGVGKTRLALQAAAAMLAEFPAGVWQVDLAPLTDPALAPVAVARALGLPDQQGVATIVTVTSFIAAGRALIVLDNCEHLLDACATLAEDLLRACPALVILATSREPVGGAGEAIWRVPPLPVDGEAVELFADRAQRARPGFAVTAGNGEAVAQICRRLDGMPLAIELAAARLRASSPAEIADGLHDRFRLLTGGARTAVRRQQTLRASVDWSHALLSEAERVLFRRLAAFAGGFDLDAAEAVGGADGLGRDQVADLLALLVDKSLVAAAEEPQGVTRYRLLETVRQYALEKLSESGDADTVRTRHRDHYTQLAARLGQPADGNPGWASRQLEADIDNLRAAFQWSLELSDSETALRLASLLQPLWLGRCRMIEGLAWFDAALAGQQPASAQPIAPEVRARAMADASVLDSWTDGPRGMPLAEEAVALVRQVGDPGLLGRALLAAGCAAGYLAQDGRPYFEEAIVLARQAADAWTLAQILGWQAFAANVSGDLVVARSAGEEGLALAEQTGNVLVSRQCRTWLWAALGMQGDLHRARLVLSEVVAEARADRDRFWEVEGLAVLGWTLAYLGEPEQARAAGEASIAIADDLGVALWAAAGYACLRLAAMAAGDADALRDASWQGLKFGPELSVFSQVYLAEAELATADLPAARQHSDEAVAAATRLGMKNHLMTALQASARAAAAACEFGRALGDACQALAIGRGIQCQTGIADSLECLAGLPHSAADQHKAARLLGAAGALRDKTGYQRFRLHQASHDAAVTKLRSSMGDAAFTHAFDEGTALTLDEAISYALRGRGTRGRPAAGWLALTPAERDIARLVGEGHANKDIAAQLFVSPRTVQTHLTHMYRKLGVNSRMQLAREAARHSGDQ